MDEFLEKIGWIKDYFRTRWSFAKRLAYLLTFFASFILLIVGVRLCSSMSESDAEKEREAKERISTLVIVTDYSQSDYYLSGDSLISGFQYELAEALGDSLNKKIQWKIENSLDKSIELLEDGDADIIARNIPITTEGRKRLNFSVPILKMPIVLVQRKEEYNGGIMPIRNQLDLANVTVYVPYNSPNILRLNNLSDEIAEPIHVKQIADYEAEQLIMMVAKGDIDYAAVDLQSARRGSRDLKEIDIETKLSFVQLQAWALSKDCDDGLLAQVDSFLVRYQKTEDYRKMRDKFFR